MRAQLFLLVVAQLGSTLARNLTFPDGFLFGAATAAYQVEGGAHEGGKGENMWDKLLSESPSCVKDNTTAEVTADSYHKYKEDIKALKAIGFNHYRFSIAWARILPKGDMSVINQAGIDYYNNVINETLANGIIPVVTMYHWDLPQHLVGLGGLSSPTIIDFFEDYARVLFANFGDRVKWWLTFNEPLTIVKGYSTDKCFPPGVEWPGVGEYVVGHNIIKAHARAYHMYEKEFRSEQKGKISIVLNFGFAVPQTNSTEDLEAADRFMQFYLGWFAHPIYSKEGDYPAVMKERIANLSKAEGLHKSRLPEFSKYWVNYIRGTADYFSLNYYSSVTVTSDNSTYEHPTHMSDIGVAAQFEPNSIVSIVYWLVYTPANFRKALKWVSDQYDQIPILITENGWADSGGLNDTMRTRYLMNHFAYLLDAIHLDNVSVIGHTVWSLIDTWEWTDGYTYKFGLHQIDFNDPERKRVPKNSTVAYAKMIKNRKVPEEYLDEDNK